VTLLLSDTLIVLVTYSVITLVFIFRYVMLKEIGFGRGFTLAASQKIFEFFSLKMAYSNAFQMQNAFGSAMLFDKPEDVQ